MDKMDRSVVGTEIKFYLNRFMAKHKGYVDEALHMLFGMTGSVYIKVVGLKRYIETVFDTISHSDEE